jgi:uridylate kinase
MPLKYPRVLLKLSGEALAGDKGFGFDFDTMREFARTGEGHQSRWGCRSGW